MIYTVVFYTHSGAIKYSKKMERMNIPCTLQPVPRKLSSSCGICAKITCNNINEEFYDSEVESIYKNISKTQLKLVYIDKNA